MQTQKTLYGLKQAPRKWFSKLFLALKSFGHTRSKNDYSLFYNHTTYSHILLLIYVDDLILAGSDSLVIQESKQFLSSRLHIKDLGILRYFLGLEIDHNATGYSSLRIKFNISLTLCKNATSLNPNL